MSNSNNSFLAYKDLDSLTGSRLYKGYMFELLIQDLLSKYKVKYKGNSRNYSVYCYNTFHDYDIVLEDYNVYIECKYLSKPIYLSWFVRDWLSRSASIIVCNDPSLLSYKLKRLLALAGKQLFSVSQFLVYVSRLSRSNMTPVTNIVFEYVTNNISNVVDGTVYGSINGALDDFETLKVPRTLQNRAFKSGDAKCNLEDNISNCECIDTTFKSNITHDSNGIGDNVLKNTSVISLSPDEPIPYNNNYSIAYCTLKILSKIKNKSIEHNFYKILNNTFKLYDIDSSNIKIKILIFPTYKDLNEYVVRFENTSRINNVQDINMEGSIAGILYKWNNNNFTICIADNEDKYIVFLHEILHIVEYEKNLKIGLLADNELETIKLLEEYKSANNREENIHSKTVQETSNQIQ